MKKSGNSPKPGAPTRLTNPRAPQGNGKPPSNSPGKGKGSAKIDMSRHAGTTKYKAC